MTKERLSLNSLIDEGRKIQQGLKFVEPDYNTIRTFDEYKLSDDNHYFKWKECSIRFLQMYSKNDVDRFIDYANKFEENQQYLPAYISNMIGVLEACNALPSKEMERLYQNNAIDEEVDIILSLEREYKHYIYSEDEDVNSRDAIEAFHVWHAAACVLFDKCFYSSDEDWIKFQDIDGSINGDGLQSEYNKIYTPYQKLLNRVKDKRNLKNAVNSRGVDNAIKPCNKEKLNIFISYSHADKKWLERLETHLNVLKRFFSDIKYWSDSKLKGGDKWKKEIEGAIEKADVAILLISTNFLASDFVATDEIPPILRKAEAGGTRILPLIVSPCAFALSELKEFQAINDPNKTLADIANDEAAVERVFLNLMDNIRGLLMV